MASNFEAQMERKMGVDAPVRGEAWAGDEGAEEREFDDLAEAMRGAGLSAAQAVTATRAAILFFGKKDREVCAAVESPEQMGWMAREEASDRLMQALGRVWGARDAALAVGCWCLAFDRPPLGVASMRDLASSRGVSPEKVSMEIEAFQEILGLPKTKAQKSAKAVASYKKTNAGKWKPGVN